MLRRVVIASVLGNAFEWFDFSIYGLFAAIIAKQFFPSDAPLTSLMFALMSFGVGFAVRPIGGVLLGLYGDRVGRKRALSLTILLMAAGTGMVGIIPNYAAIGVAAPLLIVLARMIQGASAGGEFSGATTMLIEFAPPGVRGLLGSFQMCAQALSFACGAGTVWLLDATLGQQAVESWAWRLPFLFGILIGPIGWLIRSKVDESPEFARHAAASKATPHQPVRLGELVTRYPRELLVSTGTAIVGTVSAYVLAIFLPLLARQLGVSSADASRGTLFAMAIIFVLSPLAGYLSDRLGRKAVFGSATVVYGITVWVLLHRFVAAPSANTLMTLQLAAGICMAFLWGPAPVILAEAFPTAVRATGISLTYNVAVLVFGGFAPSINLWLIKVSGNNAAPAWYIAFSVLIGFASALLMRENAARGADAAARPVPANRT